ncbi:MAG: peptidase [Deltaproteobacteria bacterium]|jgi:aminopeptidase|nr:peptidase [Deltaproteobacteria bacterium]
MNKRLLEDIASLFKVNLAVKRGDRVVVFTDELPHQEGMAKEETRKGRDLFKLTRQVASVGEGLCKCSFLSYPSLGSHGTEPPREVWEATFGGEVIEELDASGLLSRILDKSITPPLLRRAEELIKRLLKSHKGRKGVDAVIAMSRFSTSHTRFRGLLCKLKGVRYASMPLFERSMFAGPMRVDWKRLAARTEALAETIRGGREVMISTPNGTDLRLAIRGRPVLADTGILNRPGAFSNLPAGEVFLAPLEGKTEGRLVLEWAPTRRLASPVTLYVRKGVVTRIAGREPYADELRRVLKKSRDFRNIAELGIGTNERAKKPDNILESEKILGTIHIALGDNATFGGTVKTPFHQDFVFFNPTVCLVKGGRKMDILREGRLIVDR